MRGAVPSAGLLAMAMVISACASPSSPAAASAFGSVVAVSSPAVSSPAAGSASSVHVSSPAAGFASSIPVSSPAPACPAVAGWPTESTSAAPGSPLFVAGSPTLATLCQYVLFTTDGSSPPPPVLVQITGASLTRLVASLNALPPTTDEPDCPPPAQADVLVFVGAGPSSTVWLDLEGGCDLVWSDTGVHAYATNRLIQQLAAIVANGPGSAPSAATITVTPATGLMDGQTVQVTVAGLHPEDKVWLSECATAADVNPFGCGTGLPEMPFLITDDTGHASGSFTVTADIPTAAEDGAIQPCVTCVLAAVSGDAAGSPPAPTASTPLMFAPTSATDLPIQAAAPPVGSTVAATPEPGVTVTCPDVVHGDPGLIDWQGSGSRPPPSPSAAIRAVVRCALVTRTYAGLGVWQVEVAEVAYGDPTQLIAQLRAPSQPATAACGMGSQYGYPWFVLVEADGHLDQPALPTQGCDPLPSAVAAVNQLPFKVVDAVRIQAEATS